MLVEARYNGPPGSGNGGWTAGLIAEALIADALASGAVIDEPGAPPAVEVTLRRPPPLAVALTLRSGEVRTPDGTLIATAEASRLDDPPVPPVSFTEAVEASERYAGFVAHPFPTCFVCGPDRTEGDGLRLFPGRLPDGRTATPWIVPEDCSVPMVWASLDCPGGWSVDIEARPYVLGRIAVRIAGVPRPRQRCVIMGATDRRDGRKAYVRSTLYDADGTALARARSVWIALPPAGRPGADPA